MRITLVFLLIKILPTPSKVFITPQLWRCFEKLWIQNAINLNFKLWKWPCVWFMNLLLNATLHLIRGLASEIAWMLFAWFANLVETWICIWNFEMRIKHAFSVFQVKGRCYFAAFSSQKSKCYCTCNDKKSLQAWGRKSHPLICL